MKSIPTLVLPIFFIALAVNASAATYFVSPGGSDGGAGTASQPFRTIAKGAGMAVAGDTVLLMDGTYGNEGHISDGTGGRNGYASAVDIWSAGTSSAWITLKAANKGQAILDCGTTGGSLGCDKYIYLRGSAAYWRFRDLVFTRGAFGGIGTDEGASHIFVKGCRFENIGNWNDTTQIGEDGIGFDARSTDWWVEGNVFTNIGRTGGLSYLNHDHGIYAEGTNVTIINNLFYDLNKGWALQLADGATNWLIANNTFAFPSAGSGQIMLWNRNTSIIIRNNIFYNPSGYAIRRYTSTLSGCSVDHNIVYGASAAMGDSSGCSVGQNQMGADPKFMNATATPYNFHVQADGAGVNTGVGISAVEVDFDGKTRPQNAAISVGAFEYRAPANLQLANTTQGGTNHFYVGDRWTVTITGGVPWSQVVLSVAGWTGVMGYCDANGNFTTTDLTYTRNIGSWTEFWTEGGLAVNPAKFGLTISP